MLECKYDMLKIKFQFGSSNSDKYYEFLGVPSSVKTHFSKGITIGLFLLKTKRMYVQYIPVLYSVDVPQ